jgi:Bax protein
VTKQAPPQNTGKAQFLHRLRPLIDKENKHLQKLRRELLEATAALERGNGLSKTQTRRLNTLAKTYRVDGDPVEDAAARAELLNKVDLVPISLALAQAANESAWGQSRFAKEGNNLFGIWTYDPDKGIVPLKRAAGKKHLVRKFDSISDSVRYYLFTLNSHPAYAALRDIRADMRQRGQPLDGLLMADGLTKYSAKGDEYVRMIQDMIRRFDLAAFDTSAADEA